MDTVFEDIMEDIMKISFSKECSDYAKYTAYYKDKVALQSVQVKDILTSYSREEYADLFVYYPYNDRVISGTNGSANAEYYYISNYADNTHDYRNEFYQLLECKNKRPYFFCDE